MRKSLRQKLRARHGKGDLRGHAKSASTRYIAGELHPVSIRFAISNMRVGASMASTQETGPVHPAHQLGKVAYTLDVPALSLEDYVRMQRLLLRPDLKSASRTARKRRGRFWNWQTWVWVAIGGALGWAASAYDLTAELWIGVADTDVSWLFGGLGVTLLALGLLVISVFFGVFYLSQTQRLLLSDIHAAGGELFGAHQLHFGEGGILLQNTSRSAIVPWSAITEIVADKGVTFIIADRISAYWLPESLLAAMPDRAEFMHYLEQQSGLSKSGTSSPV